MNDQQPIRILASTSGAAAIRRELSRRRFLSMAAAVGVAGAVGACSPGGSSSTATEATGGDLEDTLSIYTWGEYDAPTVLTAFTEELGPNIEMTSYGSNEELVSTLVSAQGTSGFDIVVPTGIFIPQMIENGLLAALNKDLIPNIEHVDPAYLGRDWDPDNEYSICKAWGTTGFVYDTTVITRELTTWSDFIDAAQNEASGRTTLLDDPAEVSGLYFWSQGIDWNTTDEADLDALAEFSINEIAPHLAAFESYPGSTVIPQNSQALVQAWNGDARVGLQNNSTPGRWRWVLGAPATELWMDNWCIAEGAPHPEAAHAFINFTLAPEVTLQQLEYIGYHTGGLGIEEAAAEAGVELPEMIFFSDEQVATMHTGEVNESQQRRVDIWNEMKAAAGA